MQLPENVKKFADDFNKNYSRNPMGSGPYKFAGWNTGREIELVRDLKYWGDGKEGVDQPFLDRHKYRIINNMDAALVTLEERQPGRDGPDADPTCARLEQRQIQA